MKKTKRSVVNSLRKATWPKENVYWRLITTIAFSFKSNVTFDQWIRPFYIFFIMIVIKLFHFLPVCLEYSALSKQHNISGIREQFSTIYNRILTRHEKHLGLSGILQHLNSVNISSITTNVCSTFYANLISTPKTRYFRHLLEYDTF